MARSTGCRTQTSRSPPCTGTTTFIGARQDPILTDRTDAANAGDGKLSIDPGRETLILLNEAQAAPGYGAAASNSHPTPATKAISSSA